jgi:peptidoglycan/LPS O-acetylase OafA/YrhL
LPASNDSVLEKVNLGSHYVELDGLRGIAILLVLIWHYIPGQVITQPGTWPSYVMRLLSFAWEGVDIFFVLSGFLVGGMLIKCRDEKQRTSGVLVRRFFRIVPLYFFSLILFLIVLEVVPPVSESTWLLDQPIPTWSFILFLQNYLMAISGSHGANWLGITWSLALEIQFYLFLAILISLCPTDRLFRVLLGLIFFSLVARVGFAVQGPAGAFIGFLSLPTRMDSVLTGVVALLVLKDHSWLDRIKESSRVVLVFILTSYTIVVLLCAFGEGIASTGMSLVGHFLVAIATALLIVLLLSQSDGVCRKFFRQKALVFLGSVSYGVYLIHQPIAGLIYLEFRNKAPSIELAQDASLTLLCLVVTLVLAQLSLKYFESPMIAYGRIVSDKLLRKDSA